MMLAVTPGNWEFIPHAYQSDSMCEFFSMSTRDNKCPRFITFYAVFHGYAELVLAKRVMLGIQAPCNVLISEATSV